MKHAKRANMKRTSLKFAEKGIHGGMNCRLVRDEDILAIDGDEARKRRLGYNPRSQD